MKYYFTLLVISLLLFSCNNQPEKELADDQMQVDSLVNNKKVIEQDLKDKGYQTFSYTEGDSTYLMQQYFIVFLKSGENRAQDSTQAALLQEQHMAHLARMYNEGYSSLTGPMGDDGDIRGIVVYNTPTLKEADSLANLDPMVKAGRLKVEVRPWWTAKGGKLN